MTRLCEEERHPENERAHVITWSEGADSAHLVLHNILVIAGLQHLNLLLDIRDLILVSEGDDLDGNNFIGVYVAGLMHRAI